MIKFTVLSALAILIGTTIGNILVSISGVLPTSYSITTLNFSHLILLKLIQEIPVAISLGFSNGGELKLTFLVFTGYL
ncbi:MAG: hypothetical protein HC903_31100 [Methylacidiphilales bacterium]|nr:hypothetical protein [Candidatus Methylacidiphilales bacterium]